MKLLILCLSSLFLCACNPNGNQKITPVLNEESQNLDMDNNLVAIENSISIKDLMIEPDFSFKTQSELELHINTQTDYSASRVIVYYDKADLDHQLLTVYLLDNKQIMNVSMPSFSESLIVHWQDSQGNILNTTHISLVHLTSQIVLL